MAGFPTSAWIREDAIYCELDGATGQSPCKVMRSSGRPRGLSSRSGRRASTRHKPLSVMQASRDQLQNPSVVCRRPSNASFYTTRWTVLPPNSPCGIHYGTSERSQPRRSDVCAYPRQAKPLFPSDCSAVRPGSVGFETNPIPSNPQGVWHLPVYIRSALPSSPTRHHHQLSVPLDFGTKRFLTARVLAAACLSVA
jgi:hypothetical protein